MILPVILAGGVGSRLWPLSRKEYPKQFLPLLTKNSMLHDTLERVKSLEKNMLPSLIVGNKEHDSILLSQAQSHLAAINKIILEPMSKSTAPAIALAANWVRSNYKENVTLLVLPADLYIDDNIKFCEAMLKAETVAKQGHLVTFGIRPQYPETGYGYIIHSDEILKNVYKICSFREKPSTLAATEYLSNANCYWNSGIYMFQVSVYLDELKKNQPAMYDICSKVSLASTENNNFIFFDPMLFEKIPENSIDYAIMEKTDNAVVIELPTDWSDVGSWSSIWAIRKKHEADNSGNITRGNVLASDTKNTYLDAQNRLVVAVGVENLSVIETKDAVLISNHNNSQGIKNIISKLKHTKYETNEMQKIFKPWGWFEVLAKEEGFLIKKLFLNANSSISLQMHLHRSEHWVIIKGTAFVTLENEISILKENQHIFIPIGSKHRIENKTDSALEIIEVQIGIYLDENDIVRFDDQYGRETFSQKVVTYQS